MANVNGWEIDLRAVYGKKWNNREKWSLREDLYESPDGNTACLFYAIAEIGISKDVGNIAIFHDKKTPLMAFNFPKLTCWRWYSKAAIFGNDGIIFLDRFNETRARHHSKLCVLDTTNCRFAIVDSLPAENTFDIAHIEGTRYSFRQRATEGRVVEATMDIEEFKWQKLGNNSDFYQDISLADRLYRLLNF
jgi:hypothetical protein